MVHVQLVDKDDFSDIEFTEVKPPEACKYPVPVIAITPELRLKMHVLAKTVVKTIGKYETIAYVLGTKMGFGEDIVIPVHEARGAGVTVEPEHIADVLPMIGEKNLEREKTNAMYIEYNASLPEKNAKIQDENGERASRGEEPIPLLEPKKLLKPLKITGWTHSHVDFSVFSSSIDDAQHRILHDELVLSSLKEDAFIEDASGGKVFIPFFIFGITVNVMNDEYGVLYVSYPCGRREQINNVDIHVDTGREISIEQKKSIIKDIYDAVKERVKLRVEPRKYWSMPSPGYQPARTKKSLDTYYHKPEPEPEPEPAFDAMAIMESIAEKTGWDKITTDEVIRHEIKSIESVITGTDEYKELRNSLVKIMRRTKEVIVSAVGSVVMNHIVNTGKNKEDGDSTSTVPTEVGKEVKSTVDDNNYFMYNVDNSGKKIEEIQYFDDEGNAIICAICGNKLIDENNYSGIIVNGFPKCNACVVADDVDVDEQYGVLSHVKEYEDGKDDDDNDNDEEEDEEEEEIETCISCKTELEIDGNYFGDGDEEGNPLCLDCANKRKENGTPSSEPVSTSKYEETAITSTGNETVINGKEKTSEPGENRPFL